MSSREEEEEEEEGWWWRGGERKVKEREPPVRKTHSGGRFGSLRVTLIPVTTS